MDNNKSFFYLSSISTEMTTQGTATVRTGVGSVYFNLDLRRILGQKYDKFEAFNLAIEAVSLAQGSDATNRTIHIWHVDGLPFFNNYFDSLSFRGSSRVLEVNSRRFLDGEATGGPIESFTAYSNFLQNIHRVPFYRPATPIIPQFTVFLTDVVGTFYETAINGFNLIFSITGIDAYRVRRIPRPLFYRSFSKPNPVLVLRSSNATSVDPLFDKKRAFRFENVNWRQVIGSDLYDKYEKFALVTRRISSSVVDTNFATNFANQATNEVFYLSGSNLIFETRSDSPYCSANTNALSLHSGMPVAVGLLSNHQGRQRALVNLVDTYMQNVFLKPAEDVGFITIHYSNVLTLSLVTTMNPDTSNATPYPTLVFQFEIIPVVDVRA